MKYIFFIRFFAGILIVFSACQSNIQHPIVQNSLREFDLDYIVSKNESSNKKSEINKNPFSPKFTSSELNEISMLLFSSKKQAEKNNLEFSIIVYNYSRSEIAKEIYDKISEVRKSQDESILGKAYTLILLDRNYLIRIVAGCTYSEQVWLKLKGRIFKVAGQNFSNNLECLCGGLCK